MDSVFAEKVREFVENLDLKGDDLGTVFAVPGGPFVVSREEGEKILAEIREDRKNRKPMTQEERDALAERVRIFTTKPDRR